MKKVVLASVVSLCIGTTYVNAIEVLACSSTDVMEDTGRELYCWQNNNTFKASLHDLYKKGWRVKSSSAVWATYGTKRNDGTIYNSFILEK